MGSEEDIAEAEVECNDYKHNDPSGDKINQSPCAIAGEPTPCDLSDMLEGREETVGGNKLTRPDVLIAHQYQAKYSPDSRQHPGPRTHDNRMVLHGVKETSMVCQNAVGAYRDVQDPVVGC